MRRRRGVHAVLHRLHVAHHLPERLLGAEYGIQRRHDARATVDDARFDLLRRAAVEPLVVGQVGEAARALGGRAVALRTIVLVQAETDAERALVADQFAYFHGAEFREDGSVLRFGSRHFVGPLLLLAPLRDAFVVAHAGIIEKVTEAPDHGDDEQPQPPHRQRIVEFANVFVPDVRFGFLDLLIRGSLPVRPCHEPETGSQGHDRADDDVPAPRVAHD